jgi:hypothetical protein
MGGFIVFKIVAESLFSNKYGKSTTSSLVVLSKPVAMKKAAVLCKHSCVEVQDHQGQVIAQGDPIIGLREVL